MDFRYQGVSTHIVTLVDRSRDGRLRVGLGTPDNKVADERRAPGSHRFCGAGDWLCLHKVFRGIFLSAPEHARRRASKPTN